jgi:MFS family permease
MENVSDFDQLTKATRRREFDDGLMDYVFGGTFLLIGIIGWFFFSSFGLRWFVGSLLQNREITIIALIAIFALFILLIMGARRVIENIRRQTLWKNQGFVKSLRWQVSWQTNAAAVIVFVAMIVVAVWLMSQGYVNQEFVLRTLVSSSGIATGIVFFGMGKELDLQRYRWIGAVGGILSTVMIFVPISFSIAWLVLGIIWMVVLTVSGSWALRKSILELREQDSE